MQKYMSLVMLTALALSGGCAHMGLDSDIAVRRENALKKAIEKTIIPEINFENVDVRDAADFLYRASGEYGRRGRRLNIIVSLTEKELEDVPKVTFAGQNMSIADAVRAVCRCANLRYDIKGNAVYIESMKQESREETMNHPLRWRHGGPQQQTLARHYGASHELSRMGEMGRCVNFLGMYMPAEISTLVGNGGKKRNLLGMRPSAGGGTDVRILVALASQLADATRVLTLPRYSTRSGRMPTDSVSSVLSVSPAKDVDTA